MKIEPWILRAYRWVHLIGAIYLLLFTIFGLCTTLANNVAPHLIYKLVALLCFYSTLLLFALLPTFLLRRSLIALLVMSCLAVGVFLRFQLLPFSYVKPSLSPNEAIIAQIEQFNRTNYVGTNVQIGESNGIGLRWYATSGNFDLPPLLLSIVLPIIMLVLISVSRLHRAAKAEMLMQPKSAS